MKKIPFLPITICGLAIVIAVVLYSSPKVDTNDDMSDASSPPVTNFSELKRKMEEEQKLHFARIEELELRRLSKIDYHADHIDFDAEYQRIILTGRAWYNNNGNLMNGSLDPESVIVSDSKSLKIIETKGDFKNGGRILGLAQ